MCSLRLISISRAHEMSARAHRLNPKPHPAVGSLEESTWGTTTHMLKLTEREADGGIDNAQLGSGGAVAPRPAASARAASTAAAAGAAALALLDGAEGAWAAVDTSGVDVLLMQMAVRTASASALALPDPTSLARRLSPEDPDGLPACAHSSRRMVDPATRSPLLAWRLSRFIPRKASSEGWVSFQALRLRPRSSHRHRAVYGCLADWLENMCIT